mgnify:CR=1 FL=1
MANILIMEDDRSIAKILTELFTDAGYHSEVAPDGEKGVELFHSGHWDIILLDIMMPKLNGYRVCEIIRAESNIPIIMLTALDSEDAQLKGFQMKADDYITKPFSVKVLLVRVEAVLRRISEKAAEHEERLGHGGIVLYPGRFQTYVDGKAVALTRVEFQLLEALLRGRGRVLTREILLEQVWGYDYDGYEKAVNIHIMNLRRKLQTDCIETIRGVGYKIG